MGVGLQRQGGATKLAQHSGARSRLCLCRIPYRLLDQTEAVAAVGAVRLGLRARVNRTPHHQPPVPAAPGERAPPARVLPRPALKVQALEPGAEAVLPLLRRHGLQEPVPVE